jgi:hypothetical protein
MKEIIMTTEKPADAGTNDDQAAKDRRHATVHRLMDLGVAPQDVIARAAELEAFIASGEVPAADDAAK